MKGRSLLFLRISLGVLMLLWGVDKLINVEHSQAVAENFYFGIGSGAAVLAVFGVLEILLGVLVIVGLMRQYAYPALILVSGLTAVGVWKSILDPWGWFIEGTNVLFYPSLIILAASVVLWVFVGDDKLSMDAKRGSE